MSEQKKPTSIDDAIKMLDDVLVKQQIPDLSPLLGEQFTSAKESIKNMISETTRSEVRDFKDATAEFKNTASDIGSAASAMAGAGLEQAQALASAGLEQAQALAKEGIVHAKKLADDVDGKVRANPWPLIGGVALGALALGYLMARSANITETVEKNEGPTPPKKDR